MLYIYRELDQNGKNIVDTNGDAISVTNIKVRQSRLEGFKKFEQKYNVALSSNFEVLLYHNRKYY